MNKSKTSRIVKTSVMLALGAVALAGCGKLKDEPLKDLTVVADFKAGKPENLVASDGWGNGDPFNVLWSKSNVVYENETMDLKMSKDGEQLFGAEVKSTDFYGYGDYEVIMKPSTAYGTASTFFIYTGPYDLNAEGKPNPWDEIDIEFLGKNTNRVQFNYYVNGVGNH